MIFLVWKFGRDRRYAGSRGRRGLRRRTADPRSAAPLREAETPVEFVPPDDLRPGELGTLVDFEAGTLDVTATIIDLAVRGYLKIEEVDKEWYQFKHDWTLTKLPKDGELRRYERTLYDGLFRDGDEVKLSDLKNTFADAHGQGARAADGRRDVEGLVRPQAGHGEGALRVCSGSWCSVAESRSPSCWPPRRMPRCSASR